MEIEWSVSTDDITWTMRGRTEGWISLGFEPSVAMKDADMAIGWVDGEGPHIIDCFSTGETGPHPPDILLNSTDDLILLSGLESEGWTTITFKRDLNTGDSRADRIIDPDKRITIVWAMGTTDDWEKDHGRGLNRRGTLTIDLKTTTMEDKEAPTLWPIHAFCMIMAILLLADSIFVVIFFKDRWKKFLMVHKFAGSIGVIFMSLGIFTAFFMVADAGRTHLGSPHSIIGVLSIISLISLPILGFAHFRFIRRTKRLRTFHVITGWSVVLLWSVTLLTGLRIAGVL